MEQAVCLMEMITNGETGRARLYAEELREGLAPRAFACGYIASIIYECARMINYEAPYVFINEQKLREILCENDFPNIDGAIKYISSSYKESRCTYNGVRAEKAAEFMDVHFKNAQFCIGDAAEYAGVGNAELSVLFKKRYGILPKDYLLEKRLDYAVKLIENSNLPIKDIAAATGFADSPQLIRSFKKRYKITPLQQRMYYKQEHKE